MRIYGKWLAKLKSSTVDETYTERYLIPYDNRKPEFSKNHRNRNTFYLSTLSNQIAFWMITQTKNMLFNCVRWGYLDVHCKMSLWDITG